MNPLLLELDQLKAELDAMRPLPPEIEARVMQRLRLEWNYHSNAIEGNSLTLGETRSLLLNGITSKGKPLKDHLDLQGHNEALLILEGAVLDPRPITETFIRELHQVILVRPYQSKAVTPDGKPTMKTITIGAYKTAPNNVETATGETFYFASPHETAALMGDLVRWLNQQLEEKQEHPLIIAATLHYRFVRIHPFDDGNGRLARILMNLILMRCGYQPAVIRIDQRAEYLQVLQQADAGNLADFITFIAAAARDTLSLTLDAARGGDMDPIAEVDKEIALFKSTHKLLTQDQSRERLDAIRRVIEQQLAPTFAALLKRADDLLGDAFHSKNYQLWTASAGSSGDIKIGPEALDAPELIALINTRMTQHQVDPRNSPDKPLEIRVVCHFIGCRQWNKLNKFQLAVSAAFTADGLTLKSLDKPELELQTTLGALNDADLKAFVAALLREVMARFKANEPKS